MQDCDKEKLVRTADIRFFKLFLLAVTLFFSVGLYITFESHRDKLLPELRTHEIIFLALAAGGAIASLGLILSLRTSDVIFTKRGIEMRRDTTAKDVQNNLKADHLENS